MVKQEILIILQHRFIIQAENSISARRIRLLLLMRWRVINDYVDMMSAF